MQIYNSYKKEFPAVKYFGYDQSKTLYKVNSNYGMTVSIKKIMELYRVLIKFDKIESKLEEELIKINIAKISIEAINLKKSNIKELTRNPLFKLINKSKVIVLDKEIQQLNNKLYGLGISEDTCDKYKANIIENKNVIEPRLKDFELLKQAKQAIGKAQKEYIKANLRITRLLVSNKYETAIINNLKHKLDKNSISIREKIETAKEQEVQRQHQLLEQRKTQEKTVVKKTYMDMER